MPLTAPDPPLADEAVLLRPWEPRDLAVVEEACRDPYVPFVSTIPTPYADAEGLAWIERQRRRSPTDGLSLAIVDRDADRAAGAAFLNLRRAGYAGVGYWLVRPARGRGLTLRAVRLLSRWAVTEGGVRRLEALIEPWNEASQRVAEGAGFRREGVLRAYVPVGDRLADVAVYSLLPGDLA